MSLLRTKTSAVLEQMIVWGLPVMLVGAALAHGAVEAWSVLLFELTMTALLLLWAAKALLDCKLVISVSPTIWPLLGLLLLGLAQSMSFVGADGFQKSLSLDVEATRGVMLIIPCLIVGALIGGNFWASRSRLEVAAKGLTLYGLVLALFAILQHVTWNERFYWLRWTSSYAPFGSFANRNHFAGYMELLLPWPVTRMLLRWGNWQEQFFYGLAAAWIGIAASLTLSRGGMISLTAELLLIVALSLQLTRTSKRRFAQAQYGAVGQAGIWGQRFGAVAIVLAIIGSGTFWLGGQRVINRITTGQETDGQVTSPSQSFDASRGAFWRLGWTIFLARPLTGAGLGAYETAFSLYGGEKMVGQLVAAHAHNDYLQSLTDGGIIGGFVVLWFLLAVWRAAKRGLRVRDPILRASALACLAGIFGLLVHSLFDYNLQLPSHSLFFVVNAAILWQIGTPTTKPADLSVASSHIKTKATDQLQRSFR